MTSEKRVGGRDGLRVLYLITRRELLTRIRSRTYLVITLLVLVAVPGYIVLQARVFNGGASATVGFQGQAGALAQPLVSTAEAVGVHVHVEDVADAAAGRAEVQDGKLDALVVGDAVHPTVTVKEKLEPALGAALDSLVRQAALDRALAAGGVDAAAVRAQIAAAGIQLQTLDPGAAGRQQRMVEGVFVAVLLYVALLAYGGIVAQSAVEEKANRVVEIVLSTVRPRQLLLGKVIGIGLVGLLQMLLVGAAAIITAAETGGLSVPQIGVSVVAAGVLWYVLGFLLYALLYAAGASLVSRQEEAGTVTMPISVLVIGTYLALFWVLANPASAGAALLSMLPPLAPILMPARMAVGDATAWQVVVAVVLTVLTIAFLNWLGGRVYANSVLRLGTRVRLRDALRRAG